MGKRRARQARLSACEIRVILEFVRELRESDPEKARRIESNLIARLDHETSRTKATKREQFLMMCVCRFWNDPGTRGEPSTVRAARSYWDSEHPRTLPPAPDRQDLLLVLRLLDLYYTSPPPSESPSVTDLPPPEVSPAERARLLRLIEEFEKTND